jgi:hypothetical protein
MRTKKRASSIELPSFFELLSARLTFLLSSHVDMHVVAETLNRRVSYRSSGGVTGQEYVTILL